MSETFPLKKEDLKTFLSVVVPYLIANQSRLMLSPATINKLTNKYGDELTPDTYLYLITKWSDISNGRTRGVTHILAIVEKDLKKMLSSICEEIPVSVWTQTDRNMLRRKRGQKRPYTRRTAPIKTNTFIRHKLIGSGRIKVFCCGASEGMRASIDKQSGANAIQLAYCIIDPNNEDIGNEQIGKVKKEIVKSVDECGYREIHLKAAISLEFEALYHKCDVHIYARQYNMRHPELSGPWSVALIVSIP
jgi:hypothetical protein